MPSAKNFVVLFAGVMVLRAVLAAAPPQHQIKEEHPGDTALSQDANGNWIYKSFPALRALYVFDKDLPLKSKCNDGCDSEWPPLLVSGGETVRSVGDWTVIVRDDGRKQWAYKQKPVYMRYHDLPTDGSDIRKEGFRPLEP